MATAMHLRDEAACHRREPRSDDHLPRIWVTLSRQSGDNAQMLALAETLGWPFLTKRLAYRRWQLAAQLALGATVAAVDGRASSPLEPPWPDLVIAAGRDNEATARWIQRQAADRRVRLVYIGRPWSPLECFDLIVTTPQYALPGRTNVLEVELPLHRVTRRRLADATSRWRCPLAYLQGPFITVLVGGSTGRYSLDRRAASRLAAAINSKVKKVRGSVLLTTSPRTPDVVEEVLVSELAVPGRMFLWGEKTEENPYFAFLGLADEIIVTGDSMSMLAEAASTGKPVHIFDLGEGAWAMRDVAPPVSWSFGQLKAQLKAMKYEAMHQVAPRRMRRDIRGIHRYLVGTGRAVWLGDPLPPQPRPSLLGQTDRAARRVRELLAEERA